MRPVPEWEALKARLEARQPRHSRSRQSPKPSSTPSSAESSPSEKLEAAQKAAEDARKLAEETEAKVNEAREKGISLGLLQAKRNAIAEQYGLSADLLPAEEDKLDAFEKQLAASINSRTRVTPVTVEPATKTPDWMGAAHA